MALPQSFLALFLGSVLIAAACTHPPDAGLGPVPVQDAWAACVGMADGRGTELSDIVDAPTDGPTRLIGYAESATWYRNDQPLTINGRRYARMGYLRRLDPDGFAAQGRELVRVGEQEGVPLYAEGPDPDPPTVLWVPLRPGCLFQSYQRDHNDWFLRTEAPPAADAPVPVKVCVIDQTGHREVEALYRPASGDTVILQGGGPVPLEAAYPSATEYAEGKRWYTDLGTIHLLGRRYEPYLKLRTVTPTNLRPGGNVLHRAATYDGVAVFAERSDSDPPKLLYLPVRPGCLFQPYIDSAARVY